MILSGQGAKCADLMDNPHLLSAVSSAELIYEFLDQYEAAFARFPEHTALLSPARDFLRSHAVFLSKFPSSFLQTGANEPAASRSQLVLDCEAHLEAMKIPWLRHVNKSTDGSNCLVTLSGHGAKITSIDVFGHTLASVAHDNMLRLWNTLTGKELACIPVPGVDCDRKVAFSPDGEMIAVGGRADITLWTSLGVHIRTIRGVYSDSNYVNGVKGIVWNAAGTRLATLQSTNIQSGSPVVWDVATGDVIRVYSGEPEARAHSNFGHVLLLKDGKSILAVNPDTLEYIIGRSGFGVHPDIEGETSVPYAMSRNASFAVYMSMRYIDIRRGVVLVDKVGDEDTEFIAVSDSGRYVVKCLGTDMVLLELDAEKRVLNEVSRFVGHRDAVMRAMFSDDETKLYSGSVRFFVRFYFIFQSLIMSLRVRWTGS